MNKLVFDVGANVGEKTLEFLRNGDTVVCFEPQPGCAAELRKKFTAVGVKVVEKAVGERPGKLPMHICDSTSVISTLSDEWMSGRHKDFKWTKSIDVDITTLDLAIAEFGTPRHIKIDVEGFELQVLLGLSHKVDSLCFEFTKEFLDSAKKCLLRLSALGYTRFNFCRGENPNFVLPSPVPLNTFMCSLLDVQEADFWGDIYAF